MIWGLLPKVIELVGKSLAFLITSETFRCLAINSVSCITPRSLVFQIFIWNLTTFSRKSFVCCLYSASAPWALLTHTKDTCINDWVSKEESCSPCLVTAVCPYACFATSHLSKSHENLCCSMYSVPGLVGRGQPPVAQWPHCVYCVILTKAGLLFSGKLLPICFFSCCRRVHASTAASYSSSFLWHDMKRYLQENEIAPKHNPQSKLLR